MANSLSAEVWLDERRWDALEKALGSADSLANRPLLQKQLGDLTGREQELRLIGAMLDRRFSKSLRYNMRVDAPIANAVLLDTSPPTALYCPSEAILPEAEAELVEIAKDGVYPAWHWSAEDDDMPTLPASA